MVYRRTNFTDARALRAADRAMSALTELDSVLRIHVNWLAGFRDWYECRGEQRWPPQSSLAVSEFIHDEVGAAARRATSRALTPGRCPAPARPPLETRAARARSPLFPNRAAPAHAPPARRRFIRSASLRLRMCTRA